MADTALPSVTAGPSIAGRSPRTPIGRARGVVDGRRAAAPFTGIGRYVRALQRHLPDAMGPDCPLFVSGSGRRLVCSEDSDEADFSDLRRRGAKLGWEQFTLPRYVRRAAPAFLHLPW